MVAIRQFRLFCFLVCCASIHVISSVTDSRDAVVLHSLKDQWQNTPPSWNKSDDPCGGPWEGVTCNNSRVTTLGLSTMGLVGNLSSGDIGALTELKSLDLSFNRGLTGSLPPRLGDLKNLNILILAGCGFSGNIPSEIGNLAQLTFLALNTNNFTGNIPPSLGKLSNLYWLDLAENQLSGTLPVSTTTAPGLDLLKKAKHFHFNKNQLSGRIPPTLFSSDTVLIHILLDGNQLIGNIPSTLGLVQTLEVLRLDRNYLNGDVPPNLNNLTNVNELNLAHNNLSGLLPNLDGMNSLNYVDLSNNSFEQSDAPAWFSTLQSLTTLVIEYGPLQGTVPQKLFSFPQIQQVKLRNNAFNETLNMGNSISQQLQLVDLQSNKIPALTLDFGYKNTLILLDGNQLIGSIPSTLGLVQTLEVLRLDGNHLNGNIPSNFNNLANLNELNLAHNNLSGPLPNLDGMNALNYVDLSNNSFDQSEAPVWFSTLQSLTTLVIEYGPLQGPMPQKLFSFPQLQQVKLRNNAFNGTLNMGKSISKQLQLVDLKNNNITALIVDFGYNNTLILVNNPICNTSLANTSYCQI